jgi:hypothetical protein
MLPSTREKLVNFPAIGIFGLGLLFLLANLAWPRACAFHTSFFTLKDDLFPRNPEILIICISTVLETLSVGYLLVAHTFTVHYLGAYFILMKFWTKKIWYE